MSSLPDSQRPTANFRRQHADLARMAVDLMNGLDAARCRSEAGRLREALALFTGKLKVHTVMEEEELYPRLREHSDPKARDLAERFWDEFGGVYREYFAFFETWRRPGSIEQDGDGFIQALRAMLARLGARMHQENDELYAMVDRLHEA